METMNIFNHAGKPIFFFIFFFSFFFFFFFSVNFCSKCIDDLDII